MFEPDKCAGARHVAPRSGGTCPCGMVTRIPAPERPAPGPAPEILALLAQCLDDGAEALDATATRLLGQRADRLLAAFATAGLVISAEAGDRLSA